MDSSSNESFINDTDGVKVYKSRWWILFLFASLGFMQCSVWNTWGPITASVEDAFRTWNDAEIALLSMWGTITMIIGIVPFTMMLQNYGMRRSILVTASLLALATTIRIFTTDEVPFTILVHIGAILNGFAGIIICSAPSLLSSLWFPRSERTTATGIGCTFNQLGNAGGFFLGPYMVKPPLKKAHPGVTLDATDDSYREILRQSINDYLWIVAGVCVGLFILVLAYFPDKPKRPPSLSSASNRISRPVFEDIRLLVSIRNFWVLTIPYSLTLGISVAWSSVLEINVTSAFKINGTSQGKITQSEASWMGVYVTFGGVILAVACAKFTDLLFGHMKITIICLLTISTCGFIWFLLIMNGYLPFNKSHLFISVIIGASFGYACSPLFFELAVEISHPVPEGLVGGSLSLAWNAVSGLFLAILQLRMKNYIWMDYLLAIQGVCSIFVMLFVKEEYKRAPVEVVQGEHDSPLLVEGEGDLLQQSESSNIV